MKVSKHGIKQLHWDSKSMSQHELCDKIADAISDYQDKVSEVEQSIHGRLPVNNLKPDNYKVTTLKEFIKDVISSTNNFYSELKNQGDDYIGMRSDTEAFLSDAQRLSYLVDFTIKESLKNKLRNQMTENRVTISNGTDTFNVTENELKEIVHEAVNNLQRRQNLNESAERVAKKWLREGVII